MTDNHSKTYSDMSNQRYMMRGVSAAKEDVHNAIKNIDKGIFPQAFCKIIPDILGGDPEYCNIMHADGAGTKSSLAYAYWKETGDLSVWKGIAQDALIMNTDDLLCVGAVDNILVSSTIGRNKMLIRAKSSVPSSTVRTNCCPRCARWASASMPRAARQPTWATWCAPSSWTPP